MEEELNLFKGLFWGTLFSIPLWIAFFGWADLFKRLFKWM